MSLIAKCKELNEELGKLSKEAETQQFIYFNLIKSMVQMHQKYRIAKNYTISDEIRTLLNNVGIKIIQGTDGYKYEDIPKSLKGRRVQDTWEIIEPDIEIMKNVLPLNMKKKT